MMKKALFILLTTALLSTGLSAADTVSQQKFLDAIKSRELGNLETAIKSLEELLVASPNLGRARIELSVAYYRSKLFNKAREAAQIVFEDPNTPEEVKLTVTLFLAEIDAQEKAYNFAQAQEAQNRSRFSAQVAIGRGHDSNVNAGPSSGTITIGDTVLDFTPGTLPKGDTFTTYNAKLNHSYTIKNLLNIGSKPVKMLWQSSAGIYSKQYDGETAYTFDVVTVSTGAAFLSQTNWRASIPLQFDYIRLGSETTGLYTTLSPSYTLIQNKTEYSITPSFQHRSFKDQSNSGIEGNRFGVSVDAVHQFNNKLMARIGASYHESHLGESFESNDEKSVFTDLFYKAWQDGTVYFNARYIEKDFNSEDPTFLVTRTDDYDAYTLGVTHKFREGKLANWGINAKAVYTNNRSNIASDQYDRELMQVELSYSF